jgi:beta-lactamase regulating signal transducer with metallopeptidase domain
VQTLLQSGFLQALSHSLLASIWQMALVWLVAISLLSWFKWSSAQKFNIAFTAQLTGFVIFTITFINAWSHPAPFYFTNTYSSGIVAAFSNSIEKWMPYLALAYVGVLIFKFSRFAFSYSATKSLRHEGLDKIPAAFRIFTDQTAQLFSINKKVKIYLSSKIICPLTTGFLKPIILIPAAAINHLTTQQMEAVILHELAHIKRADYLRFLIQSFIDKIFFFNIFSLQLSHIIERERENACDDWVLQFRYNSMHYAEALFKLGRLKTLPLLTMPLSGKKESLLLQRIKRLLHNPQKKPFPDTRSIVLSILSISFMMVFLFSSTIQARKENPVKQLTTATTLQPAKENLSDAPKKISAPKTNKNQTKKIQPAAPAIAKSDTKATTHAIYNDELKVNLAAAKEALDARQNSLVLVQQKIDSLQSAVAQYKDAVNAQIVVTPDMLNKAISYQTFQQIENMLAAAGNSVQVIESPATKDSYQKQITIEATDKNGNKHIYTVVVELYQ